MVDVKGFCHRRAYRLLEMSVDDRSEVLREAQAFDASECRRRFVAKDEGEIRDDNFAAVQGTGEHTRGKRTVCPTMDELLERPRLPLAVASEIRSD